MTSLLNHLAAGIRGQHAYRQIRAEHDAWARDAKLGTTYYTLAADARGAHTTYVFTKMARFGPHTGQLIEAGGAASWTLWYQNGPLTTARQTTQADLNAIDQRAEKAAMARAQQTVTDAVLAEIAVLYPESARALQAA
ncbi:hypothetical protein [Kitasatospora mediocidica]|uniref:hypothetical protein n=1 Tax=Kitasatospora mediocidica TaxID=58352 RepID=UPI000560BF2F|nr:hypothetical protein [Kitasatospora mediocidica]